MAQSLLITLNTNLTHDPLAIYLRVMLEVHVHDKTGMEISMALCSVQSKWEEPRCPSDCRIFVQQILLCKKREPKYR